MDRGCLQEMLREAKLLVEMKRHIKMVSEGDFMYYQSESKLAFLGNTLRLRGREPHRPGLILHFVELRSINMLRGRNSPFQCS